MIVSFFDFPRRFLNETIVFFKNLNVTNPRQNCHMGKTHILGFQRKKTFAKKQKIFQFFAKKFLRKEAKTIRNFVKKIVKFPQKKTKISAIFHKIFIFFAKFFFAKQINVLHFAGNLSMPRSPTSYYKPLPPYSLPTHIVTSMESIVRMRHCHDHC